MCVTYPARVLDVQAEGATVDVFGRRRRAAILIEPRVQVGDWVLVGAGTVLRRLSADEARDLARTLSTTFVHQIRSQPGEAR